MSETTAKKPWKKLLNKFQTGPEIATTTPEQVDWVARPWVARGVITEVDGKPKIGKSELLLHLAKAVVGGLPFLNEPTTKGPVIYLTEQSEGTLRVAMERAGLLNEERFHVLPWHETCGVSWPGIVKAARVKCKKVGAVLLIVDTLPQFAGIAGDGENNAGNALDAMAPLKVAAATRHVAVVVVRHERKSGGEVGDSGRGSSAFAGVVDVLFSIRRPEGKVADNLREIRSLPSRLGEIPARLTIELTSQGYISHGNASAIAAKRTRAAILRAAPRRERNALTREELLKKAGVTANGTSQRAIKKLLAKQRLCRTGAGTKGDPYKFWRVAA